MSVDVLRRRRQVDDARRKFDGLRVVSPELLAPDVGDSWQRCALTLPVRHTAPVDLPDHGDRWEASAIRRAAPAIVDELAHLAVSEDYIAAITDEAGHIIWSAAGRSMTRLADDVNFVRGANWHEDVAGTNAPGLALRTGKAATVFASEHWSETVREWVCYAAPVKAPSGRVIGVLDLSTLWRKASPFAHTTVSTMARLVEQQLQASTPTLGAGTPAPLQVCVLGEPSAVLQGRPVKLSLRQFEILTILLQRGSCRLGELHDLLYGDRPVSTSTLKAEISHLRQALDGAIESRPYRVGIAAEFDLGTVLERIESAPADPAVVLAPYHGQLLPMSESPFIGELRHRLDVAVRAVVLGSSDVSAVRRFVEVHPYDLAVIEHGLELTAPHDPMHQLLAARRDAAWR